MEFPALNPLPYRGPIYRNIFTCAPSQNLLDDVCDEEDYGIVDSLIQTTSGIDHKLPQIQRVFQYGAIEPTEILSVFEKENWNIGRFGDGKDYGVWYAAEDELTSIYEACWTSYRLGKDNVLFRGEVYTTDRKMYEARVETHFTIDVTAEKNFYLLLTDSEDYRFCQALGKKIHDSKWEMLRTPSARRQGGVCSPLFSPNPIRDLSSLYYLSLHIRPDGEIHVSSGERGISLILKSRDLGNSLP